MHICALPRASLTSALDDAGQAEAVRLAIATAMQGIDLRHRPLLKKAGLLKVDGRQVERKKVGQPGARKKNAWVKR